MKIDIVEDAMRFSLHGVGGVVENDRYAEVGLRLMNEMWRIVREAKLPTTGINHWVYLPQGQMFVGVELQDAQPALPDTLQPLHFELSRYAQHLHIGPYQELPRKWKEIQTELAARGEAIGCPSLEIYGHHCDEPSKQETSIVIALNAKPTPH